MSASMTAPEQIDGLEKLITLASLRKEDIIATQAELRKQFQLTQEDQAKVAEAKAYIAKHALLAATLQQREDALAADKEKHNQAVSAHSEHVKAENTRLETFAAELATKEKEIEEAKKTHENNVAQLAADKAGYERQKRESINANVATAAAHEAAKKANEAESERLKEWEVTLKGKAARLREQAANF